MHTESRQMAWIPKEEIQNEQNANAVKTKREQQKKNVFRHHSCDMH